MPLEFVSETEANKVIHTLTQLQEHATCNLFCFTFLHTEKCSY